MFRAKVLWGNAASLNSRPSPFDNDYDESEVDDDISAVVETSKPPGLVGIVFGFMFEESLTDPDHLDDEILRVHKTSQQPTPTLWNALNTPLFIAYALTTAATAVPATLIPAMSESLQLLDDNTPASFAPRVTASAVMGTAFGKFILSSMGDICGARRTAVVCAILMSASLLALSLCRTAKAAYWACFFVEFFQAVQWPCIIVILATHYRRHGNAAYEGGIFVTSLASRFGVLVGIPTSSLLLRNTKWRWVAAMAAWTGMVASSILYLFVWDSATKTDDPQNPIDPQLLAQYKRKQPTLANVISLLLAIFQRNVAPSLKHVLKSPAFYIMAIAHTGSSAVRTSERILGSYYLDTSLNTLSENRAGGLAVFLSFGTILGLTVAGNVYTRGTERQRKRLVTRLYFSTIASCYVLAILAIPWLRTTLNAPSLVLIFQVMATFVMGFSIAVQLYHIPSLVGATFGCDKGLYAGYTDGVAYALSSLLWRVVGNSVQTDGSAGAGWAYGWAAVALILIISAIFMVEFMEHYFVRPGARTAGGYETIMFA
ncbi:expressed unknown protein [Seminavis robusta]|uniref:Uncharacterized protein n=1 Tax=Seminavis robusta TaxID=568900 RepID=A0A9N8ENC8_9STRA|nr:expressed unknown protein [Seminavis robusta]|eukprot:Sro1463_g274830.1 n/a (543) ;mRNA; f:14475-16103